MSSGNERERASRAAKALLMLGKAENLIRQDKFHEALEILDQSDEPPTALPPTQQPNWYWLVGWALTMTGKAQDSITFLEKGLDLAEQLRAQALLFQHASLSEQVERLHCYLGVAYCGLGLTYRAFEHHRRGLAAIASGIVRDPDLKLVIYKGLGNEALALGWYQEAIGYYQQALRQAENLNSLRWQGLIYWGMGLAYQHRGDLLRAKINYQRALQVLGMWGNLGLLAQVRALLGQVLTYLKELEEAELQLRKSLEGAKRLGDRRTCGIAWVNMSALYLGKNQPEQAIKAANEALKEVQQGEDPQTAGELQLVLASAYDAQHDRAATEQAIKEAIRIFEQFEAPLLLSQAHERYGQFLEEQTRYQEAYQQIYLAHAVTYKRAV